MKKLGYAIATLLEIALLFGAYIIHYFTRRKMGMLRYVIFKNQTWEQAYPIELLKGAAVAAMLLLTLILLIAFMKRRKEAGKLLSLMMVCTALLTGVYAGYTALSSPESMRAYYFMSPMFGAAALVQNLKMGAALAMRRKSGYEK